MIARIEQNAGGCGFDLVRDPESVFPASAMAWAAIFMCMRFLKRLKVGRQSVMKYSYEDHLCSNIFGFTGRNHALYFLVDQSWSRVCGMVGNPRCLGRFSLCVLETCPLAGDACQRSASVFPFCVCIYHAATSGVSGWRRHLSLLASRFPSHSHFHNPISQEVAA
ncbi:hypothetical protein [Pseudodesulfovibrio senegalensis]|uniref:Uncharacterized protein n=1 Tax=Pseudodesulfovibrio senegalensis TaxID=1721087 RepID=A0A6N6N7G0_9BACT|nr:hypothetical protein [Pseudodesulfovibrio senegalensis]KAB1443628.1 hypothetical protein F8A88_05150 [Pseudodesulfovibrio senegalensis]